MFITISGLLDIREMFRIHLYFQVKITEQKQPIVKK